jgi:hypothetical protein
MAGVGRRMLLRGLQRLKPFASSQSDVVSEVLPRGTSSLLSRNILSNSVAFQQYSNLIPGTGQSFSLSMPLGVRHYSSHDLILYPESEAFIGKPAPDFTAPGIFKIITSLGCDRHPTGGLRTIVGGCLINHCSVPLP